ncbi:MAG TPA: hypothetical protein PK657_04415 [Legionella sp.]|nr:hypothetical protein [Legionella sp.]
MKIQTALLPHKHIKFSDSIIALAGFARTLLNEPKSIDELWVDITRNTNQWVTKVTFTHLVLAIDVLFAIKQIESLSNGRLRRIVK